MYRKHITALYGYGYNQVRNRQLVEDCIQDLFMHLHLHRTTLGDTDSIRFYLFRALRRRIAEATEKQQKKQILSPDETGFTIVPSPESSLIQDQTVQAQHRQMVEALNQLPKRQREALYLLYFDGLNYQEVAEIMLLEVKSVYNLVYKAMIQLKNALQNLRILLSLLLLTCQF